mmetsp:Transcript_32955/g.102160  ORF Transcript_32955/g.102160 Transcript_32955/m.102160 type:complete len:355 (+) Transcript_32955:2786-3850(+)
MGVVAKRASAQAVDGVVPAGPKSTREISPPRSSKSKPRGADAAQRLALLRIARPGVPRGQTVERADGGLGGGLFRREEDHALRRIGRDGDRLATRRDDELAVRVQRVRETETEGALGALEEDDGGPQQIVVEEAVDRRRRDVGQVPVRPREPLRQRGLVQCREQVLGELLARLHAFELLEGPAARPPFTFENSSTFRADVVPLVVVGEGERERGALDAKTEAVADRQRPGPLAPQEFEEPGDGAGVDGRRHGVARGPFQKALDHAEVALLAANLEKVQVAVVADERLDAPAPDRADDARREAPVDVQRPTRRPLVRVRTVERRLGRGREARVARVEARPWREAVQQPRGALVAP